MVRMFIQRDFKLYLRFQSSLSATYIVNMIHFKRIFCFCNIIRDTVLESRVAHFVMLLANCGVFIF